MAPLSFYVFCVYNSSKFSVIYGLQIDKINIIDAVIVIDKYIAFAV